MSWTSTTRGSSEMRQTTRSMCARSPLDAVEVRMFMLMLFGLSYDVVSLLRSRCEQAAARPPRVLREAPVTSGARGRSERRSSAPALRGHARLREMGGVPRNPARRNHLFGVDCQTIRLPLHRCIWWAKNIAECRPLLGALPLSLSVTRRRTRAGPRPRASPGAAGARPRRGRSPPASSGWGPAAANPEIYIKILKTYTE